MVYFDAMATEVGMDATLPGAAYARLAAVMEAGHGGRSWRRICASTNAFNHQVDIYLSFFHRKRE